MEAVESSAPITIQNEVEKPVNKKKKSSLNVKDPRFSIQDVADAVYKFFSEEMETDQSGCFDYVRGVLDNLGVKVNRLEGSVKIEVESITHE